MLRILFWLWHVTNSFQPLRWWAAFWVLGLSAGVLAQGPADAVIRGRLVTAQGVGIVGARVVVRPDGDLVGAIGFDERVVRSGPDGRFVVLRVEPGASWVAFPSGVAGGSAATQWVRVEAGPGESVEVVLTAGSAGTSGSPKEPVVAESFEELPLRERDWESVAAVDSRANDADVAAVREEGREESRSGEGSEVADVSYAGQGATQNHEVVDGLTVEQSFRAGARGRVGGGARTGASFGEGAVRSLRVTPQTFSAQVSGTGGVIGVVSRMGTEALHGSAFVLTRQSAWAATNPFSVVTHYRDGIVTEGLVKPHVAETQFGGGVGFSVFKDRARAFASVEELLRGDSVLSTPSVASFYSLTANQTALLLNRGVKAAGINTALDYLDSLTGTIGQTAVRTVGFARVDVAASKRDQVTVAETLQRFSSPSGTTSGREASEAVVARGLGSVGDSSVAIDAVTGRWVHGFSARMNNEVRAQLARDLEYETPHAPLPQEPAISVGGYAPEVSIAPDGFAYGTPASPGKSAYPDERRVQATEALQWVVGRHLLTVGGDWSRVRDRIASLTNGEGTFSYDSGIVNGHAGGLVDWITDYTFNVNAYPNGGCPSIAATVHDFCFRSFTQSFGGSDTTFVTHELAGFVEDAFQPRKDLAVTLGVRYDYTLLPLPQATNRTLDAAIAGLGGETNSFPEDRNNVGPRVSVAWSPHWVTARLGYGMFYGRLLGATVLAALTDTALASSTTRVRITPKTEASCPQVANQGFGYACAYTSAPPAAVAQTTSAVVFANGFRLPAVQRGSFELEREMQMRGARLTLKAAYEMAVSTQLPGSVDRNIAASTVVAKYQVQGGKLDGQVFSVPLYTARVSSQYGVVTELVSRANATYHAGTVEARVRGGGFEARGSFTFSRGIDYAPQLSATPRGNGQFDPFTNGYDKGLSSLHFPKRFAGDLIYAPKLARGPMWVRRGLNGWRVAAIAAAGSGAPYGYQVFGGTELSGGSESINGAGGATYLPTVGRNTLRMAARGKVDLRLGREFSVRTRLRVSAFAEAFNLLNETGVSRVETRAFLPGTPVSGVTPLVFQDAATVAAEGVGTPAFGSALSSTTGLSRERQVEVGVRVAF